MVLSWTKLPQQRAQTWLRRHQVSAPLHLFPCNPLALLRHQTGPLIRLQHLQQQRPMPPVAPLPEMQPPGAVQQGALPKEVLSKELLPPAPRPLHVCLPLLLRSRCSWSCSSPN